MIGTLWQAVGLRRVLFLALGVVVVLVAVAPSPAPPGPATPDWLLAFVLVWLLRSPRAAPPWAILALVFLSDVLQQRPLGLHSALVLLVTEFARTQVWRRREGGFLGEWGIAAVAILAVMLAERLLLTLALVPQGGLGATLISAGATIAAYPLVGAALYLALGLRNEHAEAAMAAGWRA